MKNKIKRIISYCLIVLLLIILVFTLISKFVLKTELIKVFDYAFLVVLTGSMEPNIHTGELILIKEQSNYKIGEVITYKDSDNCFITHRIIEKNNDNYITQGDNNNIKDNEISINQIEGKVVFHSKLLGFFVLYILKPLTIFYIVAILIYESYLSKRSGDKYENKK